MTLREGRERMSVNLDSRLAQKLRELAEACGMSASRVAAAAVSAMADPDGLTPESADAAYVAAVRGRIEKSRESEDDERIER